MANEFKHKSVGSELSQTEYESTTGHNFGSNQAIGDLLYASSTTALLRLGIGATGAVLTVTGGIPTWDATWTPTGHLIPATDDSYDLGSASAAWQDLFLEGDITLTDAGTLATSAGALTVTSAAAATWSTSAGALTLNGTGGVVLQEGGAAIISISDARAVTTANTASIALDATGVIELNSSGGALSIGNDNVDQTINIATAGTRTLNIGIGDGTDVTTTLVKGTLSVGVDDAGYDVIFYGDAASANMTWDTSVDDLILNGAARIVVPDGQLVLGSTAVGSTAAELNVLDGVTAGTVAASKGVVVDSNKDIGSFRNLTATGELDAATLDLSSSADIAGDLVLSGGADGALQFTNAGENSIKIPDNQASALIIEEADNAYITFVTSDSSEAITVAKATTFSSNVTVSGNLTVNGTTTTVDTATLAVEDPLIALATGNNSADAVDIGIYGLYDTSGSQDLYAGLFRDANDSGKWKLFKDNQAAPTTTVNTSGTGYAVGTLVANLEGNADTVTTNANLTGDVTSSGSNATAIASGVVVDADVNASAAIAVSKTALAAGTNISLSTNTLNVDDAFLINSGNDTTSGTITAAGFTAGDAGQVYFSDTAPASDHTATGVVISIASGESVAAFNSVYIRSDGEVGPADADAVTSMPAIGVALEAKGDGEATKILVAGVLRDDTYNFTPGADLFIGTTAGEITATAPSGSGDTVQKVGVALTADSIYVNFNTTEVLLA